MTDSGSGEKEAPPRWVETETELGLLLRAGQPHAPLVDTRQAFSGLLLRQEWRRKTTQWVWRGAVGAACLAAWASLRSPPQLDVRAEAMTQAWRPPIDATPETRHAPLAAARMTASNTRVPQDAQSQRPVRRSSLTDPVAAQPVAARPVAAQPVAAQPVARSVPPRGVTGQPVPAAEHDAAKMKIAGRTESTPDAAQPVANGPPCNELTRAARFEEALSCHRLEAQGSGVPAELAWLEQARIEQRALGNPERALATLAGYFERFPGGALAQEAQLYRLDLLVSTGRRGEALSTIEALLSSGQARERTNELRALRLKLSERATR